MRDKRLEHFVAADGVRGLACLTVLSVHASVFSDLSLFPYLTGCGKIGVWLFFVLSAFLLTVRLTTTGFSRAALIDYALSRFVRIYPLMLLAVAAHFAAGLAITTPLEFAKTAVLLAGPVHFWTIPVEMAFYIVLPLIAWTLLRVQERFGDAAVLGATAAAIPLHQLLWPYWQTPENSIQLIWYLPTFMLGTAAAMMRHRRLETRYANPAIVLGIVALIVLSAPLTLNVLFGVPPSRYLMDKHLFFGAGYAILIWCVVNDRGVLRAILASRPMTFLGRISYSAYLFHWLVMQGLLHVMPSSGALPLVLVAAAVLAGWAIYALVERPLMRVRHRLSASVRSDAPRGGQAQLS